MTDKQASDYGNVRVGIWSHTTNSQEDLILALIGGLKHLDKRRADNFTRRIFGPDACAKRAYYTEQGDHEQTDIVCDRCAVMRGFNAGNSTRVDKCDQDLPCDQCGTNGTINLDNFKDWAHVATWWDSDEAAELFSDLMSTLNEYAPPDCYFGPHELQSLSYGFWRYGSMGHFERLMRKHGGVPEPLVTLYCGNTIMLEDRTKEYTQTSQKFVFLNKHSAASAFAEDLGMANDVGEYSVTQNHDASLTIIHMATRGR